MQRIPQSAPLVGDGHLERQRQKDYRQLQDQEQSQRYFQDYRGENQLPGSNFALPGQPGPSRGGQTNPPQSLHSSYDNNHILQSRSPPPLPPQPYRQMLGKEKDGVHSSTGMNETMSNQHGQVSSPSLPTGWTSYTAEDAYAEDAFQSGPSPQQTYSPHLGGPRSRMSPVRPRELSSGSQRFGSGIATFDSHSRPVSSTPSNIISLYTSTDTEAINHSMSNSSPDMIAATGRNFDVDFSKNDDAIADATMRMSSTPASLQSLRPLPQVPERSSQLPHHDQQNRSRVDYEPVAVTPSTRSARSKPPLPDIPARPSVQTSGFVPLHSAHPTQAHSGPTTVPAQPASSMNPVSLEMDASHFYHPYGNGPQSFSQPERFGIKPSSSSNIASDSSHTVHSATSSHPQTPTSHLLQKTDSVERQGESAEKRRGYEDRSGNTGISPRSWERADRDDSQAIGPDMPSPDGMASAMARRRERGSPHSLRYPSAMNRSRSIVGQTLISAGGSAKTPTQVDLPLPVTEGRLRNFSNETFADVHAPQDRLESFSSLAMRYDDSADTSFTGLLSPMPTSSLSTVQNGKALPAMQEESDYCLLSNIALLLRDAVPRGTQIKGSVSYPSSFTGKDVVSTIKALIPRETLAWAAGRLDGLLASSAEREIALRIGKSIKAQRFFHEVDTSLSDLEDSVDDVYMFGSDGVEERGGMQDFDRELSKAGKNSVPVLDADDVPTGVFTPMTGCYSPLCGKPGSPKGTSCYSTSCPRSQDSLHAPRLSTMLAPGIPQAVPGASHDAVAWASTVPKAILESLSKSEIKRQNAILELIQKEEEFLRDLELLDTLFLTNLGLPSTDGLPIMEPPQLYDFVTEVFSNHTELIGHIRSLVERLHVRQREEGPVISHIGDVYLHAALEWSGAFEANMTSFPLARHRLSREASVNPRIHDFLERCRQDARSHRLPMDHFLQRATTRLPRYNLHFKAIILDTDANSTDKESLARAIELVDEQCKSIQKGVAAAEVKVKIREYAFNLATKRNRLGIHMDLLSSERQLIHQGRVFRKPDFTDFEWQDLLCMLFDNYLVITKTKRREEGENIATRFVIEKRPIAVEMIQLLGFQDPPVARVIGLSNFHLRSEREHRDLFPFSIAHLGGRIEPLTFFVASKEARDEWYAKLQEAIGLRAAMQEANKVFSNITIFSDRFAIPAIGNIESEKAPVGVDPADFHGFVTCVYPFQMGDGRRLIAVGCADGVWIGLRHDARSLKQVLYLTLVTQIAVLEDFGILVVLSNRVLYAYSLDRLVPNANTPSNPRRGQKISENRDVAFFSIGVIKDRTLLIYMKRKPNESVFHALEPIANHVREAHDRSSSSGGGGLLSRFNRDSKGSEWFRVYKTFFIPSEAYAMQFLRSKLCIICARGFEIIDLDTMMPGTIPDFSQSSREDPRIYNLHRRVESSRALAIYKTQAGDFLLCFDSFACFVDRRGNPIRLDHFIEWEGRPHSIAFREPFLLAFDNRFIEIRDSTSGQLVQLIRTEDLRNVNSSSSSVSDDNEPIFLVQRTPGLGSTGTTSAGLRRVYDYQQVFELVGTATYKQLSTPMQAMGLSSPGDTTPTSFAQSAYGGGGGALSPTPTPSLWRQGSSLQTHVSNGSGAVSSARAGWI